nr:hypothetical protein [Tanacetum cinerariifolium]
ERFSIASRFPTPPLACAFFSPGVTVNYHLYPRYAIKECLSCGALYTGDFCCSKGNDEDKILVLNLLKICASTNVVNAPRETFVVKQDHGVNPTHIDECCCECGDALDGIFCQQCTCKSCGIAHLHNLLFILVNFAGAMLNMVTTVHLKFCLSIRSQELAEYINTPGWNRPAFYDDDNDDDVDYTIAITPVLSTEEPVDSLSMVDKHLNTILAMESDEVIKSSFENLIPILKVAEIVILEEEEIEDDNLREKLLNVYLLIVNIEALKDNPTPSSEFLTKSCSTSFKSFLEETNAFHNSLPKFENFCFDLEEISSGRTTIYSNISLLDYEVFPFYDDHIKEISNGSTTTHSDISFSEYDSFTFDLLNDQFPPTDRSDFAIEEFAGELAHIIAPPKYDRFYFWNLPDPGELISILNSKIHENPSTTHVNLPVEDAHSPILTYIVWIFLAYLTYPVIPIYLHSFGNKDTIFDPGITINHFCSFKPGLSHRCGIFKKFNTHRSHLNESSMEMLFSTCSPMDQ